MRHEKFNHHLKMNRHNMAKGLFHLQLSKWCIIDHTETDTKKILLGGLY